MIKYYLNGKGKRQMEEYGLMVTKVDTKGETVAVFGPVYSSSIKMINSIIYEIIINNKSDECRYIPEIYIKEDLVKIIAKG